MNSEGVPLSKTNSVALEEIHEQSETPRDLENIAEGDSSLEKFNPSGNQSKRVNEEGVGSQHSIQMDAKNYIQGFLVENPDILAILSDRMIPKGGDHLSEKAIRKDAKKYVQEFMLENEDFLLPGT